MTIEATPATGRPSLGGVRTNARVPQKQAYKLLKQISDEIGVPVGDVFGVSALLYFDMPVQPETAAGREAFDKVRQALPAIKTALQSALQSQSPLQEAA